MTPSFAPPPLGPLPSGLSVIVVVPSVFLRFLALPPPPASLLAAGVSGTMMRWVLFGVNFFGVVRVVMATLFLGEERLLPASSSLDTASKLRFRLAPLTATDSGLAEAETETEVDVRLLFLFFAVEPRSLLRGIRAILMREAVMAPVLFPEYKLKYS